MSAGDQASACLNLTTEIVARYAENNGFPAADLPALIASVHESLTGVGQPAAEVTPSPTAGATTARKSLSNPAHITSMIDGKSYSMLTRHIKGHRYTAQTYRQAFGLPIDYPMTASAYNEKRRALAKAIGLGTKRALEPTSAPLPEARAAAKPRTMKDALAKSKAHLNAF